MNTTYQTKSKDIKRAWHLISARGQILGRLATKVAHLLMGKHKVNYIPYLDGGDYVVITDAKDVKLTGRKEQQKVYKHYSGYPSGLKQIAVKVMRERRPEYIIYHAVAGMLPNNKLKKYRLSRLKIFAGSEHPYADKFQITNSKIQTS